jgi:hypothetical protein
MAGFADRSSAKALIDCHFTAIVWQNGTLESR